MGDEIIKGLFAIVATATTVAIIATIVSKNADTANVLTSAGKALSGVISAAVGPVTTSSSGLQVANFPGISNDNFQ